MQLGMRLTSASPGCRPAARVTAQAAQPPPQGPTSAQQRARSQSAGEASTSRRVHTGQRVGPWSARDGLVRACCSEACWFQNAQLPAFSSRLLMLANEEVKVRALFDESLETPPVPIPDPRRFWDEEDIVWEPTDVESWRLPTKLTGGRASQDRETANPYNNSRAMRAVKYSTETRCATPVTLDVVKPEGYVRGTVAPVVVLLPFYPGRGPTEIGDGLFEAQRLGFPNESGAVVVRPVFNTWPLYVDGADDAHESYVNEVVAPHLKATYGGPISLVSFGLGGWSALNLLLRNPHLYHQAAVFNAPLCLTRPVEDHPLELAFAAGDAEAMHPYVLPFVIEEEEAAAPFRTGRPRIALLAGPSAENRREMATFSHLLKTNGIQHTFMEGDELDAAEVSWEPALFLYEKDQPEQDEAEEEMDDGIRSLDEDEEEEEEEEDLIDLDLEEEDEEDEDGLLKAAASASAAKKAGGRKASSPTDSSGEDDEDAAAAALARADATAAAEEEGNGEEEEEGDEEEEEPELYMGTSWLEIALAWTADGMNGGDGREEAEEEEEGAAVPAAVASAAAQPAAAAAAAPLVAAAPRSGAAAAAATGPTKKAGAAATAPAAAAAGAGGEGASLPPATAPAKEKKPAGRPKKQQG